MQLVKFFLLSSVLFLGSTVFGMDATPVNLPSTPITEECLVLSFEAGETSDAILGCPESDRGADCKCLDCSNDCGCGCGKKKKNKA